MALKYQGNLLKESNRGVNRPNRYRLDTVVELEAGRTYTFDMDGWTGGSDWSTTFEVELTNGQHTTTVQARNYSRGLYTATFNAPHTITHVYITNGRTKTNNWNSRLEWATLVEGTERQTWWSAPLDDPIVKVEGDIIANKIYWGSRELARVYLGNRLVWELQSQSESVVSEPTFMLRGGHNGKQQQSSYISVNKQDFTNYGVDPSAVTSITVNDRKYNVTRFLEFSVVIYFYIENADTLELDGSETLTFHYAK